MTMLSLADLEAIQRSIAAGEPSSEDARRIEQAGEMAFNEIRSRMLDVRLSSVERVSALRLLALLTRHQCQERSEEVVALAVGLAKNEDRAVRSAAVNFVIAGTLLIESYPNLRSPRYERTEFSNQVRGSVREALERGLDGPTEDRALKFIGPATGGPSK